MIRRVIGFVAFSIDVVRMTIIAQAFLFKCSLTADVFCRNCYWACVHLLSMNFESAPFGITILHCKSKALLEPHDISADHRRSVYIV